MTGHLLDTNVVSELSRSRPSGRVVAFLASAPDAYLSVITFHEITYGVHRQPDPGRRAALEVWRSGLRQAFAHRTLDVSNAIAELAGTYRALIAQAGRSDDPLDALIGATAAVHDLVLVTRNTVDFERYGIRLLNPWTD